MTAVAGIFVDPADLHELGVWWRRGGTELRALALAARRLALQRPVVDEAAVRAVADGPAGLYALGARLDSTGLLLAAAGDSFARAEAGVAGTLGAAVSRFAPDTERLLALLAPSAAFRWQALVAGHSDLDPVFGLPLSLLARLVPARPGGVSPATGPDGRPYLPDWSAAPLASLAQALREVDVLGAAGRGTIAVREVGLARYVVELPGISAFTGSPYPQDLPGAFAAEYARSCTYARATAAALEVAGVPPGAELLLVGHSAGGVVAMDLAGDPAFNGGRYRVTHVLAAGAPVTLKPVVPGSGTRVLSIENVHDVVTHFDDADSRRLPVPAGRAVVTVSVDARGVGASHDASLYAAQVQMLEAAPRPAPAAAEFLASVAPYVGAPAPARFFTLTDQPGSLR